jgi:hypothetical protein
MTLRLPCLQRKDIKALFDSLDYNFAIALKLKIESIHDARPSS